MSCTNFEVVDKSEPLLILGIVVGAAGFVTSLVTGGTFMIISTGIVTVSSMVAEWRVRSLGIAKNLMDSVRVLEDENEILRDSNVKLESIVGLLGDNVGDLEEARRGLFELYEKYKQENFKHQSNNLLTLFGLVDKNEDSKLSDSELKRLSEYIKIVYKEEFDFGLLDKDDDGYVSLSEFFDKFRRRGLGKQ